MSIYDQLQDEYLPTLQGYQDDLLKHDKEAIEASPGVPFLHVTRVLGTHILFLKPSKDYPKSGELVRYLFGYVGREHIVEEVGRWADYWASPCNAPARLVHWYDGVRLRKITTDKAIQICRDYRRKIEHEWRHPVKLAVCA